MERDTDDFSYRNLSDTEDMSSHVQEPDRRQGDDLVSVVVAGDVHVNIHAGHPRDESRNGLLQPEPGTAAARGEVEPNVWESEEGSRQDVTRGSARSVGSDAGRRESIAKHKVDVPALLQSASPSASGFQHTPRRVSMLQSPNTKINKPVGPQASLHGKDLRQFVAIGAIDQIARHSNSVDWSESLATPEEMDHLSLMDPYYDLTTAKLTKLFSLFVPDEEGKVTYDGFRRGLEAMGIVCADDDEFAAFIEKVDADHSGGISYEEFQRAIQEIKLAQLFQDDFIREMALDTHHQTKKTPAILGSIEYSPDRIRSVYPIHHVEKFIYSMKPSWATVRWVSVEGLDQLLIRRLSVRYRLHPLSVEDALDVDRERPKYESYDEHSTLILHTMHPVDMNRVRTYQRMYRSSLYSRDEHEPSPFETMDKEELERRLDELRVGQIMTNPEQLSIYMLKDVLISVQERQSVLWSVVKARLDTSYSKIRQHGTPFLVYTIVDACVDELTPVVHTLGAKLVMLERLLNLDPNKFDITRLQQFSKQLKGVKRLCKPLNEVIVQMSESHDFTGEILRYFRDVQDHIAIIDEECHKHLDASKSLMDDFHNMRAAQQGDVSFILTLVAAVFLPAQFLTGLYGMNFEVMPELKWHYGYLIWWIVTLSLGLGTIKLFHKKGWM